MKAWVWLLLIILILQFGCAPGYYGSGSSSGAEVPSYRGTWYQNPETPEEKTLRIQREAAGG